MALTANRYYALDGSTLRHAPRERRAMLKVNQAQLRLLSSFGTD